MRLNFAFFLLSLLWVPMAHGKETAALEIDPAINPFLQEYLSSTTL